MLERKETKTTKKLMCVNYTTVLMWFNHVQYFIHSNNNAVCLWCTNWKFSFRNWCWMALLHENTE